MQRSPILDKSIANRLVLLSLGLSVAGAFIQTAQGDTAWIGGASGSAQDWSTAANWTNGVPLDASNNGAAFINLATGNTPVFDAGDTSTTDFDVFVGSGTGNSGRLDHRSGSLSIGTGNWIWAGENGGTGEYNLADTSAPGGGLTGFAQGSGTLNAGAINVGAWGGGGANGTLRMNTSGSLNATAGNERPFGFGDASILVGENGSSGTLNLESGTINASFSSYFGVGINSSGTLNVSGGSLSNTGILSFARGGGTGTATVSGTGAVSTTGEFWVGQDSNATFTQSGGTVSSESYFVIARGVASTSSYTLTDGIVNAATTSGTHTAIASSQGGSGTLSVSGGAFNSNNGILVGEAFFAGAGTATGILNVSGTGVVSTGANLIDGIHIGVNGNASGTVNLDGGTIEAALIKKGAGTGTFNFDGGTLKATADNATYLQGLTAANIEDGGAVIDTNGFGITVNQALLDAGGGGGLTKNGAGTLTLGSINTYTGNTAVNAGTLTLADNAGLLFVIGASGVNTGISGSGSLLLEGDFTFDLSAASSTVGSSWTIVGASLTESYATTFSVTGFTETNDVWGNGTYEYSEVTGVLRVVPEPGVAVSLLGGLGMLLGLRRRHA